MSVRVRCGVLLGLLFTITAAIPASGAIVATGFFSGTVERFDPVSGQQSTFATIASATDPFPGLAGIAFHSQSNVLYVSARISHRIYRVDGTSGAVLGFTQLADGSSPAGLAVDSSGNLYVANAGGNTVSVLDSAGNQTGSIGLPDVGLGDNYPSGLALDSLGRLMISTFAGAGVFRYNPADFTMLPFASNPTANAQIAVDGGGNVYVGGAAFSNDVLKFTEDGTEIGSPFLTIDETLLPQPPLGYTSMDFTSPSGVAIDADGNLIVAALGRTNPFEAGDNFQNNGGLWKFSPDGTLLQTFGTGITPLSGVAMLTAIPEPSSIAVLSALGLSAVVARYRRTKKSKVC